MFDLALRPGQGQTLSDYAAICQSTTLPRVGIGQVTENANAAFAKTFSWPSAAGQLGAWSVCSYQTSGSGAGQMATIVQYNFFTVTASPTAMPRPPTPTTQPAAKPTPTTPNRTASPTPTPSATVLSLPTATLPPTSLAPSTGPSSPPSGPLGMLALLAVLVVALLGAGGWGIIAWRRRSPGAMPPPAV